MSSGAMGGTGQSMVGGCDVTNCSYNQARQCHAGTIQVAFVDGMAHCATYTPISGAVGIGGSGAADEMSSASGGMDRGTMSDDASSM